MVNKQIIKWLDVVWHECGLIEDDWANYIHDSDKGVYIIWKVTDNEITARRVGQGNVKERLSKHRNDPEIVDVDKKSKLVVTWAKIESEYRDGVEAFLGHLYTPEKGERFPDKGLIEVNLPFPKAQMQKNPLRSIYALRPARPSIVKQKLALLAMRDAINIQCRKLNMNYLT